jgi:hypothetical protein
MDWSKSFIYNSHHLFICLRTSFSFASRFYISSLSFFCICSHLLSTLHLHLHHSINWWIHASFRFTSTKSPVNPLPNEWTKNFYLYLHVMNYLLQIDRKKPISSLTRMKKKINKIFAWFHCVFLHHNTLITLNILWVSLTENFFLHWEFLSVYSFLLSNDCLDR